jgi:hypothetical protein
LHPVVGVVGNVGNVARGGVARGLAGVGNVGNAPTSHVVGNVGNWAQSRVVGHVGQMVIEIKSQRLQGSGLYALYAVYPYSTFYFSALTDNHDPQCPQPMSRPMFIGSSAWAILPENMTHTMTHMTHKMLRARSH